MLLIYQKLSETIYQCCEYFHFISPNNSTHIKTMETSCISCKSNMQTKIQLLEEPNKIN